MICLHKRSSYFQCQKALILLPPEISHSVLNHRILQVRIFVVQVCLTLCYPMDCSTPDFPVLHCLLEFVQSQWCHPAISCFVAPFSSCPQSFLAAGFLAMNWLFVSGGQSIGASASVLPMNIQNWFPLGLTGLVLDAKGLSRMFSSTTVWKHQFFGTQPSLYPVLASTHDFWKNHSFD